MEFGHAIGARPLKAHDHHNVAIKFARLESGSNIVLGLENAAGCLHLSLIHI